MISFIVHVTDLFTGSSFDQEVFSCCELHRFLGSLGHGYYCDLVYIGG